jgi:hypothetical protein
MIKKELCMKCINESSNYKWNKQDEKLWNEEKINCPFLPSSFQKTNDNPVKKCPYRLEHIINAK